MAFFAQESPNCMIRKENCNYLGETVHRHLPPPPHHRTDRRLAVAMRIIHGLVMEALIPNPAVTVYLTLMPSPVTVYLSRPNPHP